MKACTVVVLAQDTAEDDECVCLGPSGLGTLERGGKARAPAAPDPCLHQRVCLGVAKAAYWARAQPSPRQERRYKGVDEKESRHWIASDQDSGAVQAQSPTANAPGRIRFETR